MAYNAVELNAFSLNDLTSRAKIVQRQRRDPGAGEVEVQIKYAGVNPSDIFSVNGDYPGFTKQLPAVPGFDGMGVVTKLGPSVIDFQEGQRVTSLGWLGNKGNGSWQQYVTLPQELLVALPDNISDEAGAQFFINPVTVVGLLEVANVAAGDWVLITAAGSTLSRMLIAAARAQGIKTIGTVRRADAVDEVKSSTGCDEVVVTSTQNLVEQVHAITGGRGAASVLDSIGGDLSEALAGAVRDGGTIWLYGVMGGPTFTGSGIATLFRGVSYKGFWLAPWLDSKSPANRKAVINKTLDLMAAGVMDPPIGTVFPLAEFDKAVKESLQVGRVGKVLLKCN